jgi:hypothetical protein
VVIGCVTAVMRRTGRAGSWVGYIAGQRITVRANNISDTVVARHGGDADGMRFTAMGTGSPTTPSSISPLRVMKVPRTRTVSRRSTTASRPPSMW